MTILDGRQGGLFKPETSWTPPLELLDLSRHEIISIDTETNDPNLKARGAGWCRQDGYIVGASMGWAEAGKAKALYAPFKHEGGDNLAPENVKAWLNHFFKNFKGTLVGQNLLYDLGWLDADGVNISRVMNGEIKVRDTMFMAALLDENRRSYALDSIAETYGFQLKEEGLLKEAAYSYGVDPKGGIWKLPARYVGAYAERDAQLPLMIYAKQLKELETNKLERVTQLEHDLLPCLLAMKKRGVRVDVAKAEQHREMFLSEYKKTLDEIKRETGLPIEVFSGDSVALGFDKLSITYPRTGKKNKASFTEDWLSGHSSKLAKLVTYARKQQRAAETFCKGMVLDKHHNGRVHCDFHPLRSDAGGSGPGRFSSSQPNLQQVPGDKDPKMGTLIRGLFLPEEEEQWAAVDYCFSDDTEVLTETGFKLFSKLSAEDFLWQYDISTKKLSLAKPTARQVLEYDGHMERVLGKFIDLLASPNHRCLLFHKCNLDKVKFLDAKDYIVGNYGQLNASTPEIGISENVESTSVLMLVAAIQADASVEVGRRITFSLKKPRKIERLLTILKSLNLPYTNKTFISKPGFSCIRIQVSDVEPLVKNYLDISSRKKNFLQPLKSLNSDLRRFFINELSLWDGSNNGKMVSYFSTNLHNVSFVQELAAITGIRTSSRTRYSPGKKPFSGVSFSLYEPITWTTKFKRTKIPYKGKIYCVTMPQATVIVRRNGKVIITGQCQQEPRLTVHYAEERGCSRGAEAAERYRTDPSTDYHNLVASLIFGDTFTPKQRKLAKTINLGISYGMGGAKLCRSLGLETKKLEGYNGRQYEVAGDEGASILAQYHAAVPFIKELSELYIAAVNDCGSLRTFSGRLSRFPWFESRSGGRAMKYDEAARLYGESNIRRAFVHAALNKKIQGGSADLIKIAMRNLYRAGFLPLVTVHDEIGISVQTKKQANEVSEIMCNCVKLRVPLLCDIDMGPSWGEAKPVLEEAT